MALQRDARYPGRWTAPSAGHPQGAFKNRSAPGALDGSYIEQDWANDWDGFFSSLLGAASITANGAVDAVGASQYYNALTTVVKAQATGRLLRTSVYRNIAGTLQVSINGGAFVTASSTFIPLASTSAIRAMAQGGGGAGAGSPITTSTQVGCGAGGSAGAFCEGFYTTGFSGASVAVGGGGVGVLGLGGTSGGSTTLGAILSAPGGPGAGTAVAQVPPTIQGNTLNSSVASGGNIFNGAGQSGESALAMSTSAYQSGRGASSVFGAGGPAIGSSYGAGQAGVGYGSGGGGAQAGVSSGATLSGGNGVGGVLIIEEFLF